MVEIRNKSYFDDYLESLLNQTECDDIEFKSAEGGFPENFWDTYSAFANTDGGTIVFGVKEKNGAFFLNGLTADQIDKYKKTFWTNVNNRSTISCNLMKERDVIVATYKGYNFMLFFVPRANNEQRPVFRTNNPYNGTFKRNYEGDYKCTEKEVRRMFADADDMHPADSRILKNYTMDDIDGETLAKYRQLFKTSSPDHPWLSLSDIELLRMLGGYRKDRQTGEEGFTVAGLLMFGKYQSITDVECTPNFFPDYQEHLTEDKDVRWTNRIYADGTWEANLFNFYQRVLPRLQSVLPKPFRLEDNIRREETPAHIAVREALINLCVHADYTENASLVVRHNANSFVFSNPGTMLISKEQYYYGGESVCRNKSLQKMFAMLGVAEKAGSGTDKIMKGWQEANWRAPNVEIQQNPDKVVLVMPMESFLSEKAKVKLEEKFGLLADKFEHNVLSVLSLVIDEGSVTNERLRYSLNLHKSQISDLLKQMCRKHLLVTKGHGRGMKYFFPDIQMNVLRSEVATSREKVATSEEKVATHIKQKMSFGELEEFICKICLEWVDLTEISRKSQRDYSYLRNKIIPRLLKEDRIEMMFPGTPNHPKQQYRIKE